VLLTATAWGTVWVVQLSASAIALLGLDVARRAGSTGPRGPFGWITAAVAAGVLSATPALAGHAASAPVLRPAPVFLDTLHVIGAAGWMGSLLLVVLAGLPAALSREKRVRGKAVADLITAFSPTALVFAGLVGVTGLFAAWLHLGSPGALWESDYGRVLLAKLLAVAAVVAIGAYNWLRMKPRLGTVEAGASVRRSAMVELTMATIVLLFTAILVATPPSIGGK
jgi:putative copper export protein